MSEIIKSLIALRPSYSIGRQETYTIFGDPTPLARARHSRQGHVYDPQKHVKLLFRDELEALHGDKPFFTGALCMEVLFYLPMPTTWSPKKRAMMHMKPHIIKPDRSNLLKFLEDCGSKILYNDDCNLYDGNIIKMYDDGNKPRTVMTITEHIYE